MLRTTLITALLALTSGWAAARPNIIVIFSDDHATTAISSYGSNLINTPAIDRLAQGGMRFNNAFVGNAVCGPSRATLLTGVHSHVHGHMVNEWGGAFNGTQQTFPKLLQAAGYQTALFGKWHLYSDPTGFDDWAVIDNVGEQGTYYNASFRSPNGVDQTEGYTTDEITDKALRWLTNKREGDKPFLLMVQHKAPHRDWLPSIEEMQNWDEAATVAEPSTLFSAHAKKGTARSQNKMRIDDHMTRLDVKLSVPSYLTEAQKKIFEETYGPGNQAFENAQLKGDDLTRWKYQRYIKSYLASVEGMDRSIGRLLDAVDATGLTDDTIILYTSDQGFYLGENGWFDKRWMYDISTRVPLLMQWPGHIEPGSTNDALVQNIDLAPTLLDAANVTADQPMHGQSILPLTQGSAADWRQAIYYHYYENPGFHNVPRHYGVRTDRWKLIHYYRIGEWELFDLQADPDEQISLHGQPGYEQITRQLEQELAAQRTLYRVDPAAEPEAPWYTAPMVWAFEQLLKVL